MRPMALASLGVAAYAAFLVATLPASFVAARAEAAARGALAVHEPRGSAWRGTARASVQGPAGTVAIDRLAWDLLPARLLQGRLAWNVEAAMPGVEARFEASRSVSSWELRSLDARGTAAGVAQLAPLAAAWRPEGRVSAAGERLAWDGERFSGEARLEWRDAALASSEVRPLGSYALEVRGDGPRLALALRTLQGPLQLSGQGSATAGGRVELDGEARAEAAQARALEPLLQIFGPRRPDGAHAVRLRLQ